MDKTDYTTARVLIIDDQEANVVLLEGYFEQIGFESVMSTTNPFDTFSLYESFQPDIILLDLMMPGLNGFEILDQIKEYIPADTFLPILVLTADLSEESKKKALSKGATDFLLKPFDLTEVGLRIRNMIQTRFLHLKLQEQKDRLQHLVDERTHDLQFAYESLKNANAELEVLDQAKLEFLSIISHEIRTPLNGIMGFTGLLKQQIDAPQLMQYINYLETSAKRLEAFSTKALLITQLRAGKYVLKTKHENLGVIVRRVVDQYDERLREKSIKLSVAESVFLSFLELDGDLLEICLDRLVDNAIRFSPEMAPLIIECYDDDERIDLKIIDFGPGFTDKAIKNLYRTFGIGDKHVDNTFGLNLAIVKQITELQGWDIRVENLAESGACVTITIPLTSRLD